MRQPWLLFEGQEIYAAVIVASDHEVGFSPGAATGFTVAVELCKSPASIQVPYPDRIIQRRRNGSLPVCGHGEPPYRKNVPFKSEYEAAGIYFPELECAVIRR